MKKVLMAFAIIGSLATVGAVLLASVAVWSIATHERVDAPIEPIAAMTTTHQVGDVTEWVVDWTLPPDNRTTCYPSTSASVTVHLPNGKAAKGARVVGLWGTDFAEGLRTSESGTASLSAWPCRGGTFHAYAQGDEGGAELTCTIKETLSAATGKPQREHRCEGTLDPKKKVVFPPPPACPPDVLTPVFDLVAPGACFGLSALELSHMAYPVIHVSTESYEDIRLWPSGEGVNASRFAVNLGGKARKLTSEVTFEGAAAVAQPLLTALTAALGQPAISRPLLCQGEPTTYRFDGHGPATAALTIQSPDCDPRGATAVRLSLQTRPAD